RFIQKKKVRKLLAMALTVGMVAGSLAGCGDTKASSDEVKEEPAAETKETEAEESDTTAASDTKAEDTADTGDLHEIYKLTERNALSGLVSPAMKDRKDIDKALPKEQKGNLTIGLSMGQMGSSFFTEMIDSATKAAEDYGYELVMLCADGNISKQSADVESMITAGYDAIILNPMDVTAAAADVKRAVEAGIPVIGAGVDFAEDVPVVTSILANNYFGGWESGLYMGEFFKDQHIKAAAILGMMGHTIDESRINGMIAGILYKRAEQQGNPYACQEDAYLEANDLFSELRDKGKFSSDKWDFEIVAQGQGDWTNEGGLAAAEDIIAGNSDINLIMAACDPMGAGAIKAIKNAGLTPGKDIYVACAADGGKEMFPYLESGEMLVTGYNSPNLNGSAAVDLIHMMFEEGYDASNLPAASDLPNGAITKENWKEYEDPDLQYCKVLPFEWKTIDQIREEAQSK
ncbi:substrate-binding domain-containing protein, partial [Lactonifactor longoviformis]|uniref:substrate-binding domain-containing protein n=1 Tax=Lactonifactor longoviformis TaxID=341220 RepID=UPI0011AF02D2